MSDLADDNLPLLRRLDSAAPNGGFAATGPVAAQWKVALPSDATGYVRVYEREDGTWDYRIRARNGEIVGPGSQGYEGRQHAVDGFDTLRGVLKSPLIDAGD